MAAVCVVLVEVAHFMAEFMQQAVQQGAQQDSQVSSAKGKEQFRVLILII